MGSLDRAILTGFICRICSKRCRVVIHVYGEEGKKLDLASQLGAYLGIDVQLNDQLPKTVCKPCAVRLKAHNDWLNHIKKVQKQIERRQKSEKDHNNG